MADEPTWDDLFGGDPTPKPAPAAPPSGTPLTRRDALAQEAKQPQAQQPTTQQPQAQQPQAQQVPAQHVPTQQARPVAPPPPAPRRSRPPRRKRSLRWLWVLIVLVLLGAAGSTVVWVAFGPQIRHVLGWEESNDYTGTGNGQAASITIIQGQNGSDIAQSLYKAGVTKTAAAFYSLLLKTNTTFNPGTYKLEKQMSAKAALADLIDPKNRIISKVVIPEGTTLTGTLSRLSKGTGVPLADFTAAAKDYMALGVPSSAPSAEGFLFPATYEFDPGLSAKAILQRLVNETFTRLKADGVAKADALKVLTLASIVQKEGGSTKDFYKVARVFQNRLDKGMLLQSDATVSYGAHSTTITTTTAQRADAGNKYNTYVHKGLPIGPISAPGDAAIKAALHPVSGPWLYFVLVNGYTGKTVFSTTIAEHNAAVLQWQAWLRAHPDFGK